MTLFLVFPPTSPGFHPCQAGTRPALRSACIHSLSPIYGPILDIVDNIFRISFWFISKLLALIRSSNNLIVISGVVTHIIHTQPVLDAKLPFYRELKRFLYRLYISRNEPYVAPFRYENILLIVISENSNDGLSPKSPAWSKEALFGLLGVLVVIVVPCIGLLVRFCVMRWASTTALKDIGTCAVATSLSHRD